MKPLLSLLFWYLMTSVTFGQDSTITSPYGTIELTKKGIGQIYNVSGHYRNQNKWVIGQVKKVRYTYLFVPTYHGSTTPANPEEFYKPTKKIGHYYKPVSDINIWHNDGIQISQAFNLDSTILRTYNKSGQPQSIYFYNAKFVVDSIYRFYQNGNIKTKELGDWDQIEDNLKLQFYNLASLLQRKQCNAKAVIECHGNGKAQRKVEFIPKDAKRKTFTNKGAHYGFNSNNPSFYNPHFSKKYSLFDLNGKRTNAAYMTSDDKWTGLKYEYYKNGNLKFKCILYRNDPNGNCENWSEEGELLSIEYRNGKRRDSVVSYKKIGDSLLRWRDPVHFKWYDSGEIESVYNPDCLLTFTKEGGIWSYRLEKQYREGTYTPYDKKFDLTYLKPQDEYGLPHGRWLAINPFQDTIFDIHFKHGYMHGAYRVNLLSQHYNWTRNYDMGRQVDSSFHVFNEVKDKVLYFATPGKYSGRIFRYNTGQIQLIDTSFNGFTFVNLKRYNYEGWLMSSATYDKINERVHRKQFNTENQLEKEIWTDVSDKELEWKSYHPGSNVVHQHWKYIDNTLLLTENMRQDYDERGEPLELKPRYRSVKNTILKTYNLQGALIKEQKFQDGILTN